MSKQPAVYILASKRNGTLYIGVTSNLIKRVWEHKQKFVDVFSEKHDVTLLVYYKLYENMESAIAREKVIKKWNRDWKKRIIEKENPYWLDLWDEINR